MSAMPAWIHTLLRNERGAESVQWLAIITLVIAIVMTTWMAFYGGPGQTLNAAIQSVVFRYADGFEGGLGTQGPAAGVPPVGPIPPVNQLPVNPPPVNPPPVNPPPVNQLPVNPPPVNPPLVNQLPVNPPPVNPPLVNQLPVPVLNLMRPSLGVPLLLER